MDSLLASHPAALGSILSLDWRLLTALLSQSLEYVIRTHLVLANGKKLHWTWLGRVNGYYHTASLESTLVSPVHWIYCDNLNTKGVCSVDQLYFNFIILGTRLSFPELKLLNKESHELHIKWFLVPGKAQSSSSIDKNLVKLVSGAYTFVIHVVTIYPVQGALSRSSMTTTSLKMRSFGLNLRHQWSVKFDHLEKKSTHSISQSPIILQLRMGVAVCRNKRSLPKNRPISWTVEKCALRSARIFFLTYKLFPLRRRRRCRRRCRQKQRSRRRHWWQGRAPGNRSLCGQPTWTLSWRVLKRLQGLCSLQWNVSGYWCRRT